MYNAAIYTGTFPSNAPAILLLYDDGGGQCLCCSQYWVLGTVFSVLCSGYFFLRLFPWARPLMTNLSHDDLINQLKDLIGEDRIKTDADSLSTYGIDWTKLAEPNPSVIVLPKTVEHVQSVVKFAYDNGIAIVPSGGRTGLSGGALAANGEIVVALDAMNQMSEFNDIDRTVVCQAGVVTEQLQNFAEENGLFYPVDFASAGSSQIGGNIATNAGGIKVIRWGMTREWVVGLKVVTGKGELLELNHGLVKNATGYDLRHLFIGAEGTLGIIVEATIQLTRPPQGLTALVLGVPEFEALMEVSKAFQSKMPLTAFEFFSDLALDKVLARGDVPAPFETRTPYYALIEFEAQTEQDMDSAMAVFEYCMEQGWVEDGTMSQSLTQLSNLWRLREDISETISHWTPYKNDISVVVSKVPEFLKSVDELVSAAYPEFEMIWFGHIGDGNLHLNILKPDSWEKEVFFEKCGEVSKQVFDIVKSFNGSISAEHGVGLLKKPYLEFSRSPEEIAYMQAIKCAFDPKNIMNPGKVFDLPDA